MSCTLQAATFDYKLLYAFARAVSDEVRAKVSKWNSVNGNFELLYSLCAEQQLHSSWGLQFSHWTQLLESSHQHTKGSSMGPESGITSCECVCIILLSIVYMFVCAFSMCVLHVIFIIGFVYRRRMVRIHGYLDTWARHMSLVYREVSPSRYYD